MGFNEVKKSCLSCHFFRLDDTQSGVCRVERGTDPAAYPLKGKEECCERWKDCGQQYYIRTGWIKGMLAKEQEK